MQSEVNTGNRNGQRGGASSHASGPVGHGTARRGNGSHASPAFYWTIGGILTVITAVEVALFYIPALAPVLVPSLLLLSAGKFLLVVMFFMHLKFDSRVFSGVFLAGMALAIFMTTALVVLYRVLPAYDFMG
jgi:cytochrome c oxidase subunit IV